MKQGETFDYSRSGLNIWQSMLDQGRKRAGDERGPVTIRWGDKMIQTADILHVPTRGVLRMECLRYTAGMRQGFDVKMKGGCVLVDGKVIPVLRTWCDEEYELIVEYDYRAEDGLISTWNVYETWRGPEVVTEKWTGNAGFWVEEAGPLDRIYHCSAGPLASPDFEYLVYRITAVAAAD